MAVGAAGTAGGGGRDGPGTVLLVDGGHSGAALARDLEDRDVPVRRVRGLAEGLRAFLRHRPETVVVRAGRRAADLLPFLSRLEEEGGAIVLCLADAPDPAFARRAVAAGAADVVCPPHTAAAVLVRHVVEARRRGPSLGSGARLAVGELSVDLVTRDASAHAGSATLTRREMEVLVRLMMTPGSVVPRDVLLRDVWGAGPDSRTVLESTVHRLRAKLGEVLGTGDAVTNLRGVGYLLDLD